MPKGSILTSIDIKWDDLELACISEERTRECGTMHHGRRKIKVKRQRHHVILGFLSLATRGPLLQSRADWRFKG
jgi:hypothetical protein